MKLNEVMSESLLDKVKAAIGTVKSKIVDSMHTLLAVFKKEPELKLTTIDTFTVSEVGMLNQPTRVDTGAATCSVDAQDVKVDDDHVVFKVKGREYKLALYEMGTVKNSNGIREVPKVLLDFKWHDKVYPNVPTKLTDRTKMRFKLLVGRNLIEQLKAPVNVSPDDDLTDADDKK